MSIPLRLGLLTRLRTGATRGAAIPATATAPALLVLDLQRDFLAEDARMPIARAQIAPVIAAANAAIAGAAARGVPVICVGNAFSPRDWLGNLVRRGAAIAGSPGAQVDPRLAATSGPWLTKAARDAFSNPALGAELVRLGVGELAIAGVFAEACVRATALGGLARGYRVTVLRDAVGGASAARCSRALDELARAGATVADVQGQGWSAREPIASPG